MGSLSQLVAPCLGTIPASVLPLTRDEGKLVLLCALLIVAVFFVFNVSSTRKPPDV